MLAGFCHAAYGTDGFDRSLLGLSRRGDLAALIGDQAEEIVYRYASCDRRYTYRLIAGGDRQFRDRFTGEVNVIGCEDLRAFMDLTFANELDLARHSDSFAGREWPK